MTSKDSPNLKPPDWDPEELSKGQNLTESARG